MRSLSYNKTIQIRFVWFIWRDPKWIFVLIVIVSFFVYYIYQNIDYICSSLFKVVEKFMRILMIFFIYIWWRVAFLHRKVLDVCIAHWLSAHKFGLACRLQISSRYFCVYFHKNTIRNLWIYILPVEVISKGKGGITLLEACLWKEQILIENEFSMGRQLVKTYLRRKR